jgi:hypothetical protein
MDFEAHLRETARHLVDMASTPLAVDHAKHREAELLQDPLYERLPELIREERARRRKEAPHG